MEFGIYSEMQSWEPKPPAQLYRETMEQVENADRLGFDAYSIVEHLFFPKFSASPDPLAFFAAAAQRTSRGGGHPDGRPLRVRRRPGPRLVPDARGGALLGVARALRRVARDPLHCARVRRRAVLLRRDVLQDPGRPHRPATVNPGGFEHWQAIKSQELFAQEVMPHFRG